MNKTAILVLQTQLQVRGVDPGGRTGQMNPDTRAAVGRFLEQTNPATRTDWRNWPVRRRDILCLQVLCRDAGISPGTLDGLWGPLTEHACGQVAYFQAHDTLPDPWRDLSPVPPNPNHWPLERKDELEQFYGPAGEASLVMLTLPYPLRLSWDTDTVVNRTRCHTMVKDSLERILSQVHQHYGTDGIRDLRLDLYGGGFNMREKRGGTSLSTHAWGIAFDFDPSRNKLRWDRSRAAFAGPEYEAWWGFWEAEGWVSLGRSKNYDWMHVQAARV